MKHLCPHSLISATISIGSMIGAIRSWIVAQGPTVLAMVGTLIAIVAGIYSIQVSRKKIKLLDIQTKNEERK
jgi:F0F1-type ATP synthase assembly protein I